MAAPLAATARTPSAPPAVPVSVEKITRRDVPIWLRGLGTVQANYSVQLRPRVDGTLTEVPVKEGQNVKQGDLLAVIDPRLYKAILDAAIAKKQQDQAQLANAQMDLARYASLVRQDFASRQQLDTQQARSSSSEPRSPETTPRSRRRSSTSASATSPRRSTAGSDCAMSIRATCPFGRTGADHLRHPGRADSSTSLCRRTRCRDHRGDGPAPLEVVVYAGDNKTELDRGVLLTRRQHIDATTGTIKLKATFANKRTACSGPASSSTRGCCWAPTPTWWPSTAPAVQHGPNGCSSIRSSQRHGQGPADSR